jgi:hypothetical protein
VMRHDGVTAELAAERQLIHDKTQDGAAAR